jgi:hypothetical protein
VFAAKIDDFILEPTDGQVDMSVAKPTAKLSVKVTAQAANGYDNVTIELKSKSFTPVSGSQRSWDGSGWTLPKTTVATTPFMLTGRDSGQLRAQRARVGEQHSGPRARYQPGIIGRSNARPMRGVGDQRGRRGFGISARSTGSLRRERAPPAIDRQSGEPDGQYPA